MDTSTRLQVVGLLDGDQLLDSRQRRVGYEHSSDLLASIHDVLRCQSWQISDLDLIVVGLGPGSFTGLRVALSVAKGLSRASQIPLIGVSTLASMAAPLAWQVPGEVVCAAIDARRGEVWAGAWRSSPHDPCLHVVIPEGAYHAQDLRAHLDALNQPHIHLVGHQTSRIAPLCQDPPLRVMSPALSHPHPLGLALLGRDLARQGIPSLRALEPNYHRPSDAELNS